MSTELVQSISIDNLLNQRDGIVATFARVRSLLDDIDKRLVAVGLRSVSDIFAFGYHRRNIPELTSSEAEQYFKKAVDTSAWQKLMVESGMLTFMDSTARAEWHGSIQEMKTVELTRDNIVSTFSTLYANRGEMLERGVIKVFHTLSYDYKTNCPRMFNKKLIMNSVFDGGPCSRASDQLDDLLRVMHVIDGKPEPDNRNGTYTLISQANRAGADSIENEYFRLKWYRTTHTGHVHFKHIDVVHEMNRILAKHFPNAIASDIRTEKPKAKAKPVAETVNPRTITPEVRAALSAAGIESNGDERHFVRLPPLDRSAYQQTNTVLEALGGAWNRSAKAHVFDFSPMGVIATVVDTGTYLHPADFGYFPTPAELAAHVAELASIEPGMTILEPSAGRGALANAAAAFTSAELVHTIEYLPFNVAALRSLGFSPREGDFLQMQPEKLHDRIVMNPPFAKQQDITHVLHAWQFLKPGGRLVAIMSAGVKFHANAYAQTFREFVSNHGGAILDLPAGAFKESGTDVNTVLVTLNKPAQIAT